MTATSRRRVVRAVAVIIPAHDEQHLLGPCLDSVHRALDHPAVRDLARVVVVVLDDCTDRSLAVAESRLRPGDLSVEIRARNVGVARATGSAMALDRLQGLGVAPDRCWLGHTDADSTVPRGWIARQLRYSSEADAVAGVVRVDDWRDHPNIARRLFSDGYDRRKRLRLPIGSHPHVHGANLGLRGDAYLEAGGFPGLACSEDHALWRAVAEDGRSMLATRRLWVTTSGRATGRAPGGFAATLADLGRAG